jgi:hypothetical protein
MSSTAIYSALPTLELPELEELATEIKELIEELKNADREPINVGDTVSFEVKGLTVTGIVASQTAKRSKVVASLVEGDYSISTKNLELLSSTGSTKSAEPASETEIPPISEYDDRF